MRPNETDLAAWAARIRPHFDEPLQDLAEATALAFAPMAGAQIKLLRPSTSLAELLAWVRGSGPLSRLSTAWVEVLMGVEEHFGTTIADSFAEDLEHRTFEDLVAHMYANRAATANNRWRGP